MLLGSALVRWLVPVLLATGVAVAAAPPAVRAQEDDEQRQAAARALFEQGMAFVDRGELDQAADRFERSLDLRFSPVVAYNLSNALVQLGRFVEASERLRQVIRAEGADPQVVAAAEAQLEQVLGRIGQLTVEVTGDLDSVEVRRDGAALSEALVGVPQPVDPGEHVVTLHRGDEELGRETVTVQEGGAAVVRLEAPPAPAPEPEPATTVPTPVEAAVQSSPPAPAPGPVAPPPEGGLLESPWFWTVTGVVVAAGIVAAILVASGGEPEPIPGDFEPTYVEVGQP